MRFGRFGSKALLSMLLALKGAGCGEESAIQKPRQDCENAGTAEGEIPMAPSRLNDRRIPLGCKESLDINLDQWFLGRYSYSIQLDSEGYSGFLRNPSFSYSAEGNILHIEQGGELDKEIYFLTVTGTMPNVSRTARLKIEANGCVDEEVDRLAELVSCEHLAGGNDPQNSLNLVIAAHSVNREDIEALILDNESGYSLAGTSPVGQLLEEGKLAIYLVEGIPDYGCSELEENTYSSCLSMGRAIAEKLCGASGRDGVIMLNGEEPIEYRGWAIPAAEGILGISIHNANNSTDLGIHEIFHLLGLHDTYIVGEDGMLYCSDVQSLTNCIGKYHSITAAEQDTVMGYVEEGIKEKNK